MKKYYLSIGIILLICQLAHAQKNNFAAIEFKAFSEVISQPKRLNFSENEQGIVFSLGYGVGIDLKYSIGQRFYIKAGSNLMNRRFKTRMVFNQAALFPEGTPVAKILLSSRNLSYQIVELHAGIGYDFLKNDRIIFSAFSELGGYKVLSANYDLATALYEDKHKKNDVFGISVLIGMQVKVRLKNNFAGLIGIENSIMNKIGKDNLVEGDNRLDRNGKSVSHNFYRLTLGIQKQF